MKGALFVISGPSGVGKGTLVKLLMQEDSSLALSVSCTTRLPRAGEQDGREYFFLTKEEFLRRKDEGDFLEYDEHFSNYYGTPKSFVMQQLKEKSVILEIDVMGADKVLAAVNGMENPPLLTRIMVAPPSMEELMRRLSGRESEDEAAQKKRLERVSYELSKSSEYDYVVINDELERAKAQLKEIIEEKKQQVKGDRT